MNRGVRVAAVLVLWASACVAGQPGDALLEPLRKQAVVETGVMVPMRDGVQLATDIARPKGEGKSPAVLVRTPYHKNLMGAAGFVRQGCALVAQDVRGRFASGGDFYPFIHDLDDGYDTVEWVAKQPWCDGTVAMTGGSYLGFTQLAAALTNPPHLRCILPTVPPADFDHGTMFFGGAMRLELAQGWLLGQSWASQRVQRKEVPPDELRRWQPDRDFHKWCWHLPLADIGPIAVGGPSYAKCWQDMVGSWEKPGAWANASAVAHPEDIRVPVLVIAGFYDIFAQENINLVLALRARGGSEASRKHSHLLIGPWVHGVGGPAGDVGFPKALPALGEANARWLPHWLKGQKNGVEQWPAIRAFLMGQDRWIETDTWPPAQSVPTKFYLGNGTLSRQAPATGQPPSAFTYDPTNPVPTLGGTNLLLAKGIRDHRRNAARADVLSFLGEPLESDLAVVGRLRAHLFVSSSAPDTDFTAMLLDARPDGYLANVQDGIVRARYREGRDKPKLLKPGEIVEVEVDLWSTAYTFAKGHRIALHVSSSNFPRFDRNLNVADPPSAWTQPQKAENKVYHDPARPSYVELPIFP